MSKEWNHYLDEITEADVEFEDIRRIIRTMSEDGIDPLDSEKVMADLCSLRYRFGFFFMAFQAVHLVSRPKGCIHRARRDITSAANVLRSLRVIMGEVVNEFDKREEKDCDFCKRKNPKNAEGTDGPEGEAKEKSDPNETGETGEENQTGG